MMIVKEMLEYTFVKEIKEQVASLICSDGRARDTKNAF